jgi:SAM-dependent methyltransferase
MEFHSSTTAERILTDPQGAIYQDTVYESTEPSVLVDWFRFEDRRILDVGCGLGSNAARLGSSDVEVHGVTLSSAEQLRASGQMKRVVLANVENWTPDYERGFFDAVLCSHVLEHLVDPERTLRNLSLLLRDGGRVYVAVPNIAYWRQRWNHLMGRFDYEDRGPMDFRHLRFFTFSSIQTLVRSAGFDILRAEVRGHFPSGKLRHFFPSLAAKMDAWAVRHFPNLFGYEVVLSASKRKF